MLGGGMRQAGILAAAGLLALEEGPKRLQIDHDNAHVLAQGLATVHGIRLDPDSVQTNIVIFGLENSVSSARFLSDLKLKNVLAVPVDDRRVRMVTHLDVNRSDIGAAVEAVKQVFEAS